MLHAVTHACRVHELHVLSGVPIGCALRNGQARRTPMLLRKHICSVRPCTYMLHGACLRENMLQTNCRRSAVWQWSLASCVPIMRRCCLRLKSAIAEASSWHVTHHTLQPPQAYLHAPVTCAELSACTTTAVRVPARSCSHLRDGYSPPAPSAWQPCHTHGSVFNMRP
jgi:hypothetical protein